MKKSFTLNNIKHMNKIKIYSICSLIQLVIKMKIIPTILENDLPNILLQIAIIKKV